MAASSVFSIPVECLHRPTALHPPADGRKCRVSGPLPLGPLHDPRLSVHFRGSAQSSQGVNFEQRHCRVKRHYVCVILPNFAKLPFK